MSANPGFSGISESRDFASALEPYSSPFPKEDPSSGRAMSGIKEMSTPGQSGRLSPWSASSNKRLFDVACVLAALPVALPVLLFTSVAVRVTSNGPVLFRQKRMGRHGESFTILKFRTMPVRRPLGDRPAVTTSINQRFTPVGPFLRRWKLDELPQIFNVLRGDMSLVGPRPKLPHHQTSILECRPGITGQATLVFAREEIALSSLPNGHLDSYYHGVVLPLKQTLDDEYMSRATFVSDIKLLVKSLFRKWNDVALTELSGLEPHLTKAASFARGAVDRSTRTHSGPVVVPMHAIPIEEPQQEG